jgi:hypothetical protein
VTSGAADDLAPRVGMQRLLLLLRAMSTRIWEKGGEG